MIVDLSDDSAPGGLFPGLPFLQSRSTTHTIVAEHKRRHLKMCRSEIKIISCLIIASLVVTFVYRQPWLHAETLQSNHSPGLQETRDLSRAPAPKASRRQHSSLILTKASSHGGVFDQRPIIGGRKVVRKNINRPLKTSQERFLIYTCNETMKCSGLSGRFKGIVTTYLFSKALNRTFGIDFTKPCDLREFLKPNYINWDIHSSKLNNNSTEFVELFNAALTGNAYSIIRKKLTQHLTADVVKVHINRNYIPKLFENPLVAQTSPEFVSMPVNQVYMAILNDLFLPSDEIQSELTTYLMAYVKKSKLVCAHVRIGQNPTIPNERRGYMRNVTATLDKIWRFLDRYNDTKKYRLYIATDSQDVKDKAKHRYANQFKDTSHLIGHVDLVKNSNDGCNILHKTVLEQLLLAMCDVLLLTPSGYGIIAAYLRNSKHRFVLSACGKKY